MTLIIALLPLRRLFLALRPILLVNLVLFGNKAEGRIEGIPEATWEEFCVWANHHLSHWERVQYVDGMLSSAHTSYFMDRYNFLCGNLHITSRLIKDAPDKQFSLKHGEDYLATIMSSLTEPMPFDQNNATLYSQVRVTGISVHFIYDLSLTRSFKM